MPLFFTNVFVLILKEPLLLDFIGTCHSEQLKPDVLQARHLHVYRQNLLRGLTCYPPDILSAMLEDNKLQLDESEALLLHKVSVGLHSCIVFCIWTNSKILSIKKKPFTTKNSKDKLYSNLHIFRLLGLIRSHRFVQVPSLLKEPYRRIFPYELSRYNRRTSCWEWRSWMFSPSPCYSGALSTAFLLRAIISICHHHQPHQRQTQPAVDSCCWLTFLHHPSHLWPESFKVHCLYSHICTQATQCVPHSTAWVFYSLQGTEVTQWLNYFVVGFSAWSFVYHFQKHLIY